MDKSELIKKLDKIQKLTQECLSFLSANKKNVLQKKSPLKAPKKKMGIDKDKTDIDLSIPLRPFIKKYSRGMSGPKKFTLLLAHLSRGDFSAEVNFADIEKAWSSMTALFGAKFNPYYSQVAKDNDWAVSKKRGTYSLRPSWTNILD